MSKTTVIHIVGCVLLLGGVVLMVRTGYVAITGSALPRCASSWSSGGS